MPTAPPRQPLLAARNVRKVYTLGEQVIRAVDEVSFEIHEGEYVAIVGSSGSGKSTMMHLMGALDVPTAGEMHIDGRQITGLTIDSLADLRNRTIGFVFQQFNLLPRATALRQVMLPLAYAKPLAKDAEGLAAAKLRQVGLGDRLYHYPQQLSGGQQQRVAIARALVNNPKLLLADEPTGALDTKTSAEVIDILNDLNAQGITIVLVTHDAEVARHARRRIAFRDGTIVEDSAQLPHDRALAVTDATRP
jgi:putative ABC transport system ATP-binding protein